MVEPATLSFTDMEPQQFAVLSVDDNVADGPQAFTVDCAVVSADALWENGFGVVFPELEGTDAFDSVGATLDLIAALAPRTIIPGHGSPFSDLAGALQTARTRLDYFQRSPQRHRNYAAKVLLKFKLLELQHTTAADLTRWALATPYIALIGQSFFKDTPPTHMVQEWIAQLVSAGAATADGEALYNRD